MCHEVAWPPNAINWQSLSFSSDLFFPELLPLFSSEDEQNDSFNRAVSLDHLLPQLSREFKGVLLQRAL